MSIPASIKAEYARKRSQAQAELEARLHALYQRIPGLGELAERKRQAIFALGIARLKNPDDVPALLARIAQCDQEQAALLAQYDLPANALAPQYQCARCEDTGYVGADVKTPCACLRQRLSEVAHQSVNLREGDRFENFREDIFPDDAQRRRTRKLRDICEAYADGFTGRGPGLLLYGECGLGKTFLLNCIAHRLLDRGFCVADVTVYGLMGDVMESIRTRTAPEDYIAPDALILDDLGSEPDYGSVTVQTLFSILNERQLRDKPTLIASNLSEEALLDAYGERLFSRLVAPSLTEVYRLSGADLRRVRTTQCVKE